MRSVARYRVVSPFIAVRGPAYEERLFTVTVGCIIETSAPLDEPGLVKVTLNGESLVVFCRDIKEHTERIEDKSSIVEA